jgi:hypothetical protein
MLHSIYNGEKEFHVSIHRPSIYRHIINNSKASERTRHWMWEQLLANFSSPKGTVKERNVPLDNYNVNQNTPLM